MSAPIVWRWYRVIARVLAPVVARRLATLWVALACFYAVFEQAIRPFDLMRDLEGMAPEGRARVALAALALVTLVMRPHTRALILSRALAPAWRAPIPRLAWAMLLLPYVLMLAAPLGVVGVLWPGPRPLNVAYFLLAGAPAFVAIAGAGAWALAAWCACVAFAGAWAWVTFSLELAWLGALVGAPVSLWLTSRVYDLVRGRPPVARAWGMLLRPRGPFGSLVWRDLTCLWRLERGALLGALLAVCPLVAFTFAVGRHGGPVGTTLAALGALASLLPALWIVRLQGRLGEAFEARRWPLGPGRRAAALLVTCNLPLALLYAGALVFARGWTPEQLAIAFAALPVYACSPLPGVLWTRWWSNAGYSVVFAALVGFFITRAPAPVALGLGVALGALGALAARFLLARARQELP